MSSTPPYTPPGGGAPPPYDPRTQWRVYREQQKAAWRAQRDQMRAQRHQWKAGYSYGPRVPSMVGPILLIGVGVVALLILTGHIDSSEFWTWYGRWWPLLLIGAGIAMLGEWALDMKRKSTVRRGGNFAGILIFLAILGMMAAWGHRWWGPMQAQWGENGDDFFNMFGKPQRDMDQQVLNTRIPANATIQVQNPRGDVAITGSDSDTMQVESHAVAYADSDAEANKIFASEAAHVTVNGNTVLVKSDGNSSGRLNLTIALPRSARVNVTAGHGEVIAANLGAGATITSEHGKVQINSITGSVDVHLNNKSDFSAHQVTGDITADGRGNDLTLTDVQGKVLISGELSGGVHMERLAGTVHLHTSVTELEMGSLPGDMSLNDEDLHVTEARGQVRVVTHSKNVDLSQIYGDIFVEDRDGNISIEPAGTYNVEAKSLSGRGDIKLTLPPNASASVTAFTHNGDILSDYSQNVPEGESKKVSFTVGNGGARINLSTDVGDVRIDKGSGLPPPSISLNPPKPPAPPSAPHLKAPKTPAEPVTQ